jgi:hypothetical protein
VATAHYSVLRRHHRTLFSRFLVVMISLANMTRRGLIYDSASGPIDFSGPRCIFPFRSSAFYEPSCLGASARLRAYARTRLFTVPSPLGVTQHQDSNVHIHTYPKDQISISALLNMQSVHRDWVVNRDLCSPKPPRHGQRQSSNATGARRCTEERYV